MARRSPPNPGSAGCRHSCWLTAAFLALGLSDSGAGRHRASGPVHLPPHDYDRRSRGVPLTALPDWAQRVAGLCQAVTPLRFSSPALMGGMDSRAQASGWGRWVSSAWRQGSLRPGCSAAARPVPRAWSRCLYRMDIRRRSRLANGPPETCLARSGSVDDITERELPRSVLPVCRATMIWSRPSPLPLVGPGEFAARLRLWPREARRLRTEHPQSCLDRRRGVFVPIRESRRLPGWCSGNSDGVRTRGRASSLDDPRSRRWSGSYEGSRTGSLRHPPERLVRQRSVIYAEKFLGLLGKIPN